MGRSAQRLAAMLAVSALLLAVSSAAAGDAGEAASWRCSQTDLWARVAVFAAVTASLHAR